MIDIKRDFQTNEISIFVNGHIFNKIPFDELEVINKPIIRIHKATPMTIKELKEELNKESNEVEFTAVSEEEEEKPKNVEVEVETIWQQCLVM